MTIAIGISCPEGAVLVTDSLFQRRTPTGVQALVCMTPKFEPLPAASGVAITSGMFDGAWCHRSTLAGIEAATTDLVEDLGRNLAATNWDLTDGRSIAPGGEAITAGLSADGTVRMCHAAIGREPRWADPQGDLYVGGAATDWGVHARPTVLPNDLAGCAALALDLARRFVRETYAAEGKAVLDDFLTIGTVPAIAPPFHMAVVRPHHVDLERFSR